MSSSDSESEGVTDTRSDLPRHKRAVSLPILKNDDDDTLRIMLSTDNHLGYAERDPVRGMDSFAAFEEVLHLAKRFHCDMVLIGGDLFHENRPSRRTLHKTMEIIRRYCLGPGAVRIQILSDQAQNFRNTVTGVVNYQDPNYSVDLPVFSIHGNHDDPSRDSGGELLAALDLLAVSNLVNYWGRQDQVDKVEISPVLIQKGDTKIALYGLGSMRDERLNRMWESKKVRFLRPEEDNDDDDDDEEGTSDGFFNIFVLHQNRDLGRGSKNCIQESMIPEWMDLVIWGHEHECLIEFFESVVGTFRITQPGSSVATSLVAGEAARKKVGILDINGKNFRLHPVPLTQVRSFVTIELSLRDHRADLDPDDPKIESKVTRVLEEEVQLMVMHARKKREQLVEDSRVAGSDTADDNCTLKYRLEKPNEVLVRIRVEHMGFSTLNNQRFGAKFVGEVANPTEMLLFHRKKDPKLASTVSNTPIQPIAPEELERTNMEDLIKEQLEGPDSKLKLLEEKELSLAMEEYVEKSLLAAIPDKAHGLLKKKQMKLIKTSDKGTDIKVENASEVREILEREATQDPKQNEIPRLDGFQERNNKRKGGPDLDETEDSRNSEKDVSADNIDDDDFNHSQAPRKRASTSTQSRSTRSSPRRTQQQTSRRKQLDDLSDDDEVMEVAPPTKARSKPATRPKRGASRKANYTVDEESDEDVSDASVEDEDLEDDEVLVVEEPRSRKRSQTARSRKPPASSRAKSTSGTARKKPAKKTNRRHRYDDSDDEDEEVYVKGSDDLDDDWGTAATASQF